MADIETSDRRLESVPVADEVREGVYDRELFHHWDTVSGCSVRERVLIDESQTPAQVDPFGCVVVAGDWRSLYDGVDISDPAEMEIDHLVPLAEAWRSGAWAWDEPTRQEFANDLAQPYTLIAVSASTNQSKGDADPSDWKPPDATAWCRYATDWIAVKTHWGLSADHAEVEALGAMLDTC